MPDIRRKTLGRHGFALGLLLFLSTKLIPISGKNDSTEGLIPGKSEWFNRGNLSPAGVPVENPVNLGIISGLQNTQKGKKTKK